MDRIDPSLDPSLEQLLSTRFVVVTGKGGVGKTTVTAALARLASRKGKQVLVAEVGSNPNAPSSLIQTLTGRAIQPQTEVFSLLQNIDAVLLTPDAGHRAFLRDVMPLGFLAERALKAEPLKRFLNAAPAFAELGVLYQGLQLLKQERRKGVPRWDLVLLDSPATGHAIAFASLPHVVQKLIPAGPIGRAVREGLELLNDPARTKAIVTTLPEALPVSEALELVAGLEKHKVDVHGLVVNLVPTDPFTADEHQRLHEYFTQASSSGDFLGARSLGRLRRATHALGRLKENASQALFTVREQLVRGPSLVEAVASELASVT